MQITPADPQLARRLQLVPRMHAQGRSHQLPLETSNRFMERAFRKFLCDFLQDGESLQFLRQIFYSEMFIAIRQHQAAFDYVLQLPNVARPVMLGQGVQKPRVKP